MAYSERKLVAILAADVVGYSRLMEVDEAGTLARLKTHRLELIDPAITKRRGRIIKTTGDGLLVEFQSVVDAVECATEIQTRMARRNADVSPARAIQIRIGINLGDVIVEDDDIFGDGQPSPAASAMTCALLTMGTALKSKVSKVLPAGNRAPARCRSIRRRPRSAISCSASAARKRAAGQPSLSARAARAAHVSLMAGKRSSLSKSSTRGGVNGIVVRHAATSRLETGSTTWTAASSS
jgi:Adenylate and Guanylate cyclase catalytic domain